jgi:hypothetical protein
MKRVAEAIALIVFSLVGATLFPDAPFVLVVAVSTLLAITLASAGEWIASKRHPSNRTHGV